VPDAWLAALAIESGCELVTTDRDHARFPGLRRKAPAGCGAELTGVGWSKPRPSSLSRARDPHVYTHQTREYVSLLFTVEGMQ
jgi:hypothetical protein